jgi:hypothetical protein
MRRAALVTVALVALSACVRRADAYGRVPHVDERRLANLQALASREMACPAVTLAITPLDMRVYQVTGCGMVREWAIMGRGRGRYQGAQWRPVVPIGQRASAEMACPPEGLAIAAPLPTERTASGCGRAATYAILCGDLDCAWVMTSHTGAWAGAPEPSVVIVPATGAAAPAQ